ncbi:hypothetical protein LTR36_004658 [Oleoguttula mirabilis]|uniref:DRBM domain-containing protein n=1 Tax=Oleoguttula mirabilis TaxID=1507867 RepID=A0AAV9JF97_9PEZI|nr:hypothetical protein LTR36_004658 [Oleoguttula mirabilis]
MDLLKHLLVRKPDGSLTPASSPAEQNVQIARQHTHVSLDTALTPKARASLKRKATVMATPVQSLGENTPPPSAQAIFKFPSMDVDVEKDDSPNLQDIGDFEKENPWSPKPKLFQVKATKINPECAIRFNNLCVNHLIVPNFTYGVSSATVSFGGEVVEAPGPFVNKKHAKEEVCRLALPVLQKMEDRLKSMKRKTSEAPASRISTVELNSENFVGILQDHAQAKHLALPEYTEARTFTTPIRFACAVRIADGPLTPFGSDDDLYPSKQEAKRAAAREAVLWLRSQSRMPAAMPAKRVKIEDPRSPTTPGQTGLTQLVNDMDVDAADATTLPQRVHEVAASLGFSSPVWDSHPSLPPPGAELQPEQMGGSFVSMSVRFCDRDAEAEPRLRGTVAKVDHVFGKKKARELCCRELLHVLEQIRQSRLQ